MAFRSPAEFIENEFNRRKMRNPAYSMRAFAQALGVSPGRLSEIMTGKQVIGFKIGERIAVRLGLTGDDRALFFQQLLGQAAGRVRHPSWVKAVESYLTVPENVYDEIADWQHYALLSLMETEDFSDDPAWMAARLGLEKLEVERALARLVHVGLAAHRRGHWRPTYSRLTTTTDVPSEALKKSHRQVIERALNSFDKIPVDQRDVTSQTFAADPRKIAAAKAMIREFRRGLVHFLEGDNCTEVFDLNIQLLPITRPATARADSARTRRNTSERFEAMAGETT